MIFAAQLLDLEQTRIVFSLGVDGERHCVDASIYYEAEIGDQICLEYS